MSEKKENVFLIKRFVYDQHDRTETVKIEKAALDEESAFNYVLKKEDEIEHSGGCKFYKEPHKLFYDGRIIHFSITPIKLV